MQIYQTTKKFLYAVILKINLFQGLLIKQISVYLNFPVLKNFLIYSFGAFFLRLITSSIAFISILFLSPSEYGFLALLNTFIGILPIFLNLGLRQAFGIDYFHVDNNKRKEILNEIIFIYLVLAIPILFLLVLNINVINQYCFLNQASYLILLTVFSICFLNFFCELLFQTLRYQSKAFHLTAIQILMGLINATFAIILIYFFKFKITGIILANLFSLISISIYGFYLYIQKINLNNFKIADSKKFTYYLKLGFPFVPNILFTWTISFADRWILAKYSSLHDVGIYSLADSFGQLYQLLILYPLSGSYLPYIFNKFAQNKNDKFKILEICKENKKNMWLTMFCMASIIALLFALLKSFFYIFFPVKFYESINYIWYLIMGQIIFMGSYFATAYLVFYKRTYLLMFFTMISAIINVILNIILIPKFNIYGSVIATIISYIIYLIMIIFATKKIQKEST